MPDFTDYDNFCGTVARWLARDDLTEDIKNFIWLAEVDIQRTVKFRMRDEIATGTTTDGEDYITLPDDYVEGGFLQWTSDSTLPSIEVTSYNVWDNISKDPTLETTTSVLRAGVLHGDRLYIAPTPGTVDYRIFYKAGVQHLSQRIPTNRLLTDYPDTLLYGSLLTAAPFLGADERIQTWLPFYQNGLEETRKQEWRARTGHGLLRMRPDVQVF